MNISHKLSRLSITGPISMHTPACVLFEIADAHGITCEQNLSNSDSIRSLVNEINEKPVKRIIFDSATNSTHLQLVARFVNSHHNSWTRRTLKPAFDFLMQFNEIDSRLISKIPDKFEVGSQTSDCIFSINACILYGICRTNNIVTNSSTTIKQMAYAVKLLKSSAESVKRRAKQFTEIASQSQMISMLISDEKEIEDAEDVISVKSQIDFNSIPSETLSTDILFSDFRYYTTMKYLQRDAVPRSPHDCSALLALTDNFDISRAINPFSELKEFRAKPRNTYIPEDPWMKYWFLINPKLFNLTVTFNPLFPREFYKEEDLSEMAISEGYEPNFTEDSYEILQLAHLSDTFYYGMVPNVRSEYTVIDRDPVTDVTYGELVCYGQKDVELKPISIEELINLFETNQNFSSPFGSDEIFSKEAINKLKIIARNTEGPGSQHLSMETIELKIRLISIINKISALMKNYDIITRQFILKFSESDDNIKSIIKNTLNSLLHVGMYMRGWSGQKDFPLGNYYTKQITHEEIEEKTSAEIIKFESLCESLNDKGINILNLPLVIFKGGEYQTSNTEDEGLTIGDRLAIVKEGDKSDTMNSCIRLSSNWICSTCHKYTTALGFVDPFDIYLLKHIH